MNRLIFVIMFILMLDQLTTKPIEIEFVGRFPKGCGFAYMAKKKIMDTLVQELSLHQIPVSYKIETGNHGEFSLLVKDPKSEELVLIGTSGQFDAEYLPYLHSSKTDKDQFIITVIEKLHKHKII